jgi:intracellular sulfur oxidation DsrE/DsrF family protein
MSLLEKLSINKKITAFFVDGTSKMNLGIATVVDLLNGAERVPVEIAPLQRASRLLTDLAESAGRTVEQAEEGVFLVQPVVSSRSLKLSLSRSLKPSLSRSRLLLSRKSRLPKPLINTLRLELSFSTVQLLVKSRASLRRAKPTRRRLWIIARHWRTEIAPWVRNRCRNRL